MNLRFTQNLWLFPGNRPWSYGFSFVGPGFPHFSWVLISVYPIGGLGNGASISQRTVQIWGLAGMWGIIWG